MKKAALITGLLFAGFALFAGCANSDGGAAPKGSATPEELIANYANALNTGDMAAWAACLSKEAAKKILDEIRGRENIEVTILEKKISGDKGTVRIKDNRGSRIDIVVIKEDGFWKFADFIDTQSGVHEGSATGSLSAIRSAQGMYKAQYKEYGTLANLGAAGFIEDNAIAAGRKGGYTFTEDAPTMTSWCVYATPDDPASLSAFKMDRTGVLQVQYPGTTVWVQSE
jgi:hypothetical protein